MAFSKVPDKCFLWRLNEFNGKNIDTLEEKTYLSSKFTTSVEPNREWKLQLTVKRPTAANCSYCGRRNIKSVDIKLIYNQNIPNPEDIKVDVSIKKNVEKITRSFIISGTNREFGYENFMDSETMLKMVHKGILEITVELFLKNEKKQFEVSPNYKFLHDIQINIQGQKFYAHKIMLARKSPYFYAIFEEDDEIKEMNDLDEIKPETFQRILAHIYDEPYNVVLSDAENFLLAANYLEMDDLKLDCENYFRNTITEDTVCSILALSIEHDAKFLMKHCQCYILKNFHHIDFEPLKTMPLVALNTLKEIFEQFEVGRVTIIDKIILKLKKEVNTINLSSDYGSFLNNERYSDITIEVDKKIAYKCHKLVLSANSPVFCNMLMSNMEEALTNVIKIQDIEPDIFYEVLRFIYTGKVENLSEYGIQILEAADRYNLENLQKLCEEFLAENLTHENVVDFTENADRLNASFLLQQCCSHVIKTLISYPKMKKMKAIITLDMFLNCRHNVFYDFLNILKNSCEIKYVDFQ